MLRIWVGVGGGAVNTQKTEGFRAVKKKKDTTPMDRSLYVVIHLLEAMECTAPRMSPT